MQEQPNLPPEPLAEKINMSEARYNDLVFMMLKYFLFLPAKVPGPRECDIRMCMQMGCQELFQEMVARDGIMTVVLRPDEQSPRRHDKMYDINPTLVFNEVIIYIEEHWLKEKVGEEIIQNMKIGLPLIIDRIMRTPEEDCAKENTEGAHG